TCCYRFYVTMDSVSIKWKGGKLVYFLLNFPAAPVFAFLADLLGSGSLRLAEEREPVTLKKSSRRPWVLPWRLLLSRLTPLRIRSSENCFSPHMNLTSSSSFGSLHFSSTDSGSSTSGSRKSCWASLWSQFSGTGYLLGSSRRTISSMLLCFWMRSTARLGPMPRILSQ
uniref:Uncharacterized protein n=1 Tax=Rhinolophus ferrumequinum TaxID=59479 RepID=A0A671DRJ1_RHIFE